MVEESFAEKRAHSVRLPVLAYDAVLTVERRISHEGMVSIGGNRYSVPDTVRSRVLEVQHHAQEVRIFEQGELITRHAILEGRNQRRVDPRHHRSVPCSGRESGSSRVPSPMEVLVSRHPLTFYDAAARRLSGAEENR